eukprot:s352_g17.t1
MAEIAEQPMEFQLSSGAASGRSVNSHELRQKMVTMHLADRKALVGTHLQTSHIQTLDHLMVEYRRASS